MTGQLEEEKMQVYVRLGIRLLYKVRALCPLLILLTDILYLSSSRALRVEWKVHEVRMC